MKTNTIERPVAIEAGESAEFTIKANGKAFRALISTLYENKIQSIVREIWSNALDGHVAAGNEDRPFLVTFPTAFNPVFSVRDYGISLNHADIMKLYTTVFESTKEDTNDATGKFGLGSKSPFAYTDTFTVTAVMDGMKRHYSAVIGKTGIPSIHFLGEHETDEERGIEVSFPIQSADVRKFRDAALRISHGFDVKPEVATVEDDDNTFPGWPQLDTVLEGSDWKILKGNIEGYSAQAYAKMGPVLYPININAIDELTSAERQLLSSTLVIEFPMGALEMTPSREALSYGNDEPTIPSIRAKLRSIVQEALAGYQARYDACTTYWQACMQYAYDTKHTNVRAIVSLLEKEANWNGKALVKAEKITQAQLGRDTQLCVVPRSKLQNKKIVFNAAWDIELQATKDVIVFIEDEDNDKRAGARIKMYLEENSLTPEYVYWVRAATEGLTQKSKPKVDLQDYVEGLTVIMVDDLEMPARNTRSSNGGYRRPVQARVLSQYDHFKTTDLDNDAQVAGGFYVKMERNEVLTPPGMSSPRNILGALIDAGYLPADTKVYGAPKTIWKAFTGDQWVDLFDFAAEQFGKSQPKASIAKAAMINAVTRNPVLTYLADNLRVKDLEDGPAKEALEFFNYTKSLKVPEVAPFVRLGKAVGQDDKLAEWSKFDDTDVEYHKLCVEEAYPLLKTLREQFRYSSCPVDMVAHYVQVCDKAAAVDSAKLRNAA